MKNANSIESAVVIEIAVDRVDAMIVKTAVAAESTGAWDAAVAALQGEFVKPVEICIDTAVQYDMGKPVTLLVGSTAPAEVATDSAAKPVARSTKSEAVRALIRAARATGANADAVAAQAQRQLSMTKALAAVYVKNNWACK